MKRKILLKINFSSFLFFASLIFLLLGKNSSAQNTNTFTTISDGSWALTSTWQGGNIPDYNGTSNKNFTININHTVFLDGDFQTGNNEIKLFIDGANVRLEINGNFYVNNIDIEVRSGAGFIVGIAPPVPAEGSDIPPFDYCCEAGSAGCNEYSLYQDPKYPKYLFYVGGSAQKPSLKIFQDALFRVFGDFNVQNNFEIKVDPGGVFDVLGGFEAGNSAEVELVGDSNAESTASVGCDMEFNNNASINMSIASLEVGGDLLFGNGSTIYVSGSTIDVGGSICSYMGQGFGAVITIVGSSNNPSIVNYGDLCDNIQAGDGVILPVELLKFVLKADIDAIVLNWTTGTEINNDYFTIERSRDLFGWEILGYETGAGNSSTPINYSFSDLTPLDGLAYYRLKQTDFDGKFKYYGPIAAHYDLGMEGLEFKVMKQFTKWVIAVPNDGIYQVELYNLSGQRLISEKVSNTLSVPAPDGAVVIRVTDGLARSVSRVVM